MTDQNLTTNSRAEAPVKPFHAKSFLWLLPFAAALAVPGCNQSAGQPKEPAVKKDVYKGKYKESWEPIEIIFTDVPEVPEEIQGPSPPLEKKKPKREKTARAKKDG